LISPSLILGVVALHSDTVPLVVCPPHLMKLLTSYIIFMTDGVYDDVDPRIGLIIEILLE